MQHPFATSMHCRGLFRFAAVSAENPGAASPVRLLETPRCEAPGNSFKME